VESQPRYPPPAPAGAAGRLILFKPMLFNTAPPPPLERIEHVVAIAVKAFMAACGKKK